MSKKLKIIDWNSFINEINDENFQNEIINDFLSDLEDSKFELKNAIHEKNFQKIKLVSHKIKGAASYLYCQNIYDISYNIQLNAEYAMKDNNNNYLEKIKLLYEDYLSSINDLIDFVSDKFNK